jgi:uncharacterized SAM-binding protein YcdF (DUF218 family)
MRRAGRPTPGLWMTRRLAQSRQFGAMIAPGRKRLLRLLLAGIVAAFVLFCAATARLFIWPTSGMPAHVDAIVMLAGPGDRPKTALRLASERRAPFLVVSRGFNGYGGPCPAPVPPVKLICFEPSPASTQGEAEFAGRLARRHHWHSVTLVTSTVQDSRARQRMQHCFAGHVYVVTVGLPRYSWPTQIAHEWAATIKMVAWQRGC